MNALYHLLKKMDTRRAKHKDFKELLDLAMRNMRHHMKLNDLDWGPIEGIRRAESDELRRALRSPKTIIIVAEKDGRIVGYITLSFQGKSPYTTKKKGTIDDLFVLEHYRRRGIGKSLIDEALISFKSRGVEIVSISVSSQNLPTIRMYETFNFKEHVKKMHLQLERAEMDPTDWKAVNCS